jgi:hypothetical protein
MLHTHTVAVFAWSHAGHVEKNSYATPKQALENKQNPESKQENNQSCGSRKTKTIT